MGKLTIVPKKNSESLAPKHLEAATRAWFGTRTIHGELLEPLSETIRQLLENLGVNW